MEGKFLRRARYKNVENNQKFFTPEDLVIGGDVKINGWGFHILSCDDYTRKFIEEHFD